MGQDAKSMVESLLSEGMVKEQRRLMGMEPTLPSLEEAKDAETHKSTSSKK